MQYPILQLLPKKDRAILNHHPWVFSGAIKKNTKAQEGDIVEVQSDHGNILGYGFFSTESQIACRIFHWDKVPALFQTVEYWKNKIQAALLVRRELLDLSQTNSYRILHAEGDDLPGLIADVYMDTVVLQINIKGINQIKVLIFQVFRELGFKKILVRSKLLQQEEKYFECDKQEYFKEDGKIQILENGLKFFVDILKGQKTGFFIDQRENRQILRQHALGKTVLNAFSYTGGFSIYALAGGAKEVHSLDISEEAAAGAEENAVLNGFREKHKSVCKDCFEYLKEMPSDFYDIIVLDPPAFAKNSRSVDNAAKGYKQINMKAIEKVKSSGLVFTFSCSQHISKDLFQKIVFGAAADVKRNVRIVKQLHQPEDHPINIYHPEGEYLKGLLLWVE